MQELINKRIVKGLDIDEHEADGTQIIKWYKGKVTTIRNKKKAQVVWDDENERNDWKKLLPNKQKKLVDGSWQKNILKKYSNLIKINLLKKPVIKIFYLSIQFVAQICCTILFSET